MIEIIQDSRERNKSSSFLDTSRFLIPAIYTISKIILSLFSSQTGSMISFVNYKIEIFAIFTVSVFLFHSGKFATTECIYLKVWENLNVVFVGVIINIIK